MATQARVAGTVNIDGEPAVRDVIVIKDDPAGRQVVAEGQSASDGTFDITYADWAGGVVVLAIDTYGAPFQAEAAVNQGEIIHPTMPNGYVYEVTVAGSLGTEEPEWATDASVQSGGVTMNPRPYYRPVASGPLTGELVEIPSDPYFDNVITLLHMEGADGDTTFTDVTGRTWTAHGDAQIDTTQFKFGSSSLQLDGSNDWLETPDSDDFDFGSGDFTIEAWIRPGAGFTSDYRAIISQRASSSSDHSFSLYLGSGDGKVTANVRDDGGSGPYIKAGTPDAEQWNHVALVRSGNEARVYLNGFGGTPKDVTGMVLHNSSQPVVIGVNDTGHTSDFLGHIDELRVTKGVARYTDDFTPPDAPFLDNGPL